MHSLIKPAISGIGGAVITGSLFLGMIAMIHVDFEAAEKFELEIQSINPIEDIKELPPRREELKLYKKVETPPPPPVIDVPASTKPSEPIAEVKGDIPLWKPYKGGFEIPMITISDRDAACLICIAPQMPPRATRSGHCKMRLDVDTTGTPYNITPIYCSENLFSRNSVKAVQKFKYQPKVLNGRPVDMRGVETTITYRLSDENGRIIPE